ncbi:hypothetical protein [Streptomyces sp. NPDC086777]|uniref:hypothetical protein n=1 Tax=Streptomyces sp. NPDC086777 TaxID=3154866 RepID=UPI00344B9BB1
MNDQQPYGAPPFQEQPPRRKPGAGRIVGLGCLGLVGLVVVVGAIGAAVGGSGHDRTAAPPSATKTGAAAGRSSAEKADDAERNGTPKGDARADTVVFKVWGSAPAGALGGLDITYGSDTDTRKGTFKNGRFEATLPLSDQALYFNVMAQLQGSGDINCSVTVDRKTKNAHASGGYTICNAQLTGDFTGGWR